MPLHRSVILTYHSLDATGSAISVAPELLRRQMDSLARNGARVVDLCSVCRTPGSVAVTAIRRVWN